MKRMFKSVLLGALASACLSVHAQERDKPDMLLVFPKTLVGDNVEIGIASTSTFQLDWGDGVRRDYDYGGYLSNTLMDDTLRVYGSNIWMLHADKRSLTSVVINNEPDMDVIKVPNNNLADLDVSMCPSLSILDVANNGLRSLVLGSKMLLEVLSVGSNKLSAIDVSGCGSLDMLIAFDNELTSVGLGNNSKLTVLCLPFSRL